MKLEVCLKQKSVWEENKGNGTISGDAIGIAGPKHKQRPLMKWNWI